MFSGIGNTSNVALNSFFWHDRIPTDATRAISVTTGTYKCEALLQGHLQDQLE